LDPAFGEILVSSFEPDNQRPYNYLGVNFC
jgi:hypothetical protein